MRAPVPVDRVHQAAPPRVRLVVSNLEARFTQRRGQANGRAAMLVVEHARFETAFASIPGGRVGVDREQDRADATQQPMDDLAVDLAVIGRVNPVEALRYE